MPVGIQYGNANCPKGISLKNGSRLCDGGGCVALYTNAGDVLDIHLMTLCYAVRSMECHGSYGTIVLDHLAADGAGFAGSQVTVVTVGQVDAHFGSSLHLELVHGLTSLGDIDLVVALHKTLSFVVFPESVSLSWGNRRFLSASIV